MKLMRITSAYPVYVDKLYVKKLINSDDDYSTQYKNFCMDCYGWADFWSRAFGELGYECWEPVGNIESMQKKWARENSIKFSEENWKLEIVLAQVKIFQPNILLINDYYYYNFEFIKKLRSEVSSIKFVIGWCGAPYNDEKVFKAYDLVLTNLPTHYKKFTSIGLFCKLINHAFDPIILTRMGEVTKTREFNFVGSIVKGNQFHNERNNLIELLLKKTDLVLYSDLNPSNYNIYKIQKRKKILKSLIRKFIPIDLRFMQNFRENLFKKFELSDDYQSLFENYHPEILVKKSKPGVFGLDMYRTLAKSNITLNQHIDISKNSSNNMRLYEATGVGTCLLTDWSEDLKDKFKDDEEVVSYKSKEELLEKVSYLKKNPKILDSIAKKGQLRTLENHTFFHRAVEIDEIIKTKV
ncbi:MAG: glycosyltransferase [Leptospiraceae bacterium]|nr:glycosyltransferase [Leptospiraceae bacterium]